MCRPHQRHWRALTLAFAGFRWPEEPFTPRGHSGGVKFFGETVNIETYQNVIRRFCEHERLNADQLLSERVLTIDGRRVAIHFAPEISAHHVLVRAELGKIPHEIQPACHRSMLMANYQWGLDGTVFGLQPGSEEAVATTRIPASASTTPQELREALDVLGAALRHWTNSLEDLRHHLSSK